MSQPQIKIVPFQQPDPNPQVTHAYQPEEPAEFKPEEKPVGQMYPDEFTELMVKAILQADKVKGTLESKSEPARQEEKNENPVAKVFGTLGDVAHGVVDIAEGVLRGAVDIVTFGKAKRND